MHHAAELRESRVARFVWPHAAPPRQLFTVLTPCLTFHTWSAQAEGVENLPSSNFYLLFLPNSRQIIRLSSFPPKTELTAIITRLSAKSYQRGPSTYEVCKNVETFTPSIYLTAILRQHT